MIKIVNESGTMIVKDIDDIYILKRDYFRLIKNPRDMVVCIWTKEELDDHECSVSITDCFKVHIEVLG